MRTTVNASSIRFGDEIQHRSMSLGTVTQTRRVKLGGRPGIEFVLVGPGGGEMLWAAKPGRRVEIDRPEVEPMFLAI